ncbi:MAG: hypothetical protein KF846_06415 [Cyclobacteriaceae bacterium]|nr:hypothetical protein [Cyclobacteriaceae bacterium]
MIAPKDQQQPNERTALIRARITALVIASVTIVSLLFLVYAFIQKAEAEKNMQEAQVQKQLYEQCQQENQKVIHAAQESQRMAEMERARAEENYLRSLQELEKLKSNRK